MGWDGSIRSKRNTRTEDDQNAPVLPRGRPGARLHAHLAWLGWLRRLCVQVNGFSPILAVVGYASARGGIISLRLRASIAEGVSPATPGMEWKPTRMEARFADAQTGGSAPPNKALAPRDTSKSLNKSFSTDHVLASFGPSDTHAAQP